MQRRVLVVEDDVSIGAAVRDALEAAGYDVEWSTRGDDAMAAVTSAVPDLVLLDAGLPDIDGFTVCRWLRAQHRDLPVILVTARDADIDVVVGLDAGASDYVTKPFSMTVLLARVRAHLRNLAAADPDAAMTFGSLRVDPAAHTTTVDGVPIELRRKEFELLLVLCREAGKVVTRQRLLAEVWDVHWDTSTKTLDMHILGLRRKLADAIEIATVRGVGYRLAAP